MPSVLEPPLPVVNCEHKLWAQNDGFPPACADEPFYALHEGKNYCVLHYPDSTKATDFRRALQKKLDAHDYNFRGVWFPSELNLEKYVFGSNAYFNSVTFSGIADFSNATFEKDAEFFSAHFNSKAKFNTVTFKSNASFVGTTFIEDAEFRAAKFEADAYFNGASFAKNADFFSATFSDLVRFTKPVSIQQRSADSTSLNFQIARMEKPDHVFFHEIKLRPHWFVEVDPRKFNFIDVEWVGLLSGGYGIADEIEVTKRKHIRSPNRLLAIACQQLAVNAEENSRYEEASKFRYWAMDARRREKKGFFSIFRLHWFYWAVSGYGERSLRAFIFLIGIWLLFAFLYTQVGFLRWEPKISSAEDVMTAKTDETGTPLRPLNAALYSLGVITLQKPDPKPATFTSQTLIAIETFLGPLQVALLALAIRRQFMR